VNAAKILDSGRQIKVISLILAEIYDEYVYNPPIMDDSEDDDNGVGYTGAVVIDTVPGYRNGPCDQVILGDFASLYPSCQVSLYTIADIRYNVQI